MSFSQTSANATGGGAHVARVRPRAVRADPLAPERRVRLPGPGHAPVLRPALRRSRGLVPPPRADCPEAAEEKVYLESFSKMQKYFREFLKCSRH